MKLVMIKRLKKLAMRIKKSYRKIDKIRETYEDEDDSHYLEMLQMNGDYLKYSRLIHDSTREIGSILANENYYSYSDVNSFPGPMDDFINLFSFYERCYDNFSPLFYSNLEYCIREYSVYSNMLAPKVDKSNKLKTTIDN